MVRIVRAEFESSAADPAGWPPAGPDAPAEVAFVGRSNVGKSSLLNALAERRGLARTSSEPGRTRLINFFRLELIIEGAGEGAGASGRVDLRFVDLPGFGYAAVSRAERSTWRPAIERYLTARAPLRAVVLLVDARRVPLRKAEEAQVDEELSLSSWIASRGIEVVPTLTKADKLAKHERPIVAERLQRLIGRPVVLASAVTLEGRERLWDRLIAAVRGEATSV